MAKGGQRSTLVFVYGSNLYREQMLTRCPGARFVGPAGIVGYELAFAGYSASWRGAVATMIQTPERAVLGALWDVSPEDLGALDGYEGPRYRREHHHALTSLRAPLTLCDAYVHEPAPCGKPSRAYVDRIKAGYMQMKFPTAGLHLAVLRSRHGTIRT